MAFVVSLLLGFIPMFLFAAFVNWLDHYEKEPKILLGVVFFWGAIVAAGGAFLMNTVFGMGVYLFTESEGLTEAATGSLIAPAVEETLKGLAVLFVFLVFRTEFDSILDGVVYAAITAMGFAATENVQYIFTYGYQESGWAGMAFMAFVRIILVGWQHPFYTSFVGIGLALARMNRSIWIKIFAPYMGLMVAMLTHSLHNTISPLLINNIGMEGMLLGSLYDWAGWISMFIFVLWMVFHERKMVSHYLKDEVEQGTLTEHQYLTASSLFGQSKARLQNLFTRKFAKLNRFYQLCGELTHKKRQLEKLGEETNNSELIGNIRSEMAVLSAQISQSVS